VKPASQADTTQTTTQRMRKSRSTWWVSLSLSLGLSVGGLSVGLLAGCQTNRSMDAEQNATSLSDSSNANRPPAMSVLDIPPPPGFNAERMYSVVSQLTAQPPMSEDALRAQLTDPDFAKLSQPPRDHSEPSLEIQRAYAAGRWALREGQLFNARQLLEQALTLAPENPVILRTLGETFARSGDLEQAAQYLKQAAIYDPEDVKSLYLLGKTALGQQEWQQAAAFQLACLDRLGISPFSSEKQQESAQSLIARYHLAAALQWLGYTQSSADQLHIFLHADIELAHSSFASRELVLLMKKEQQHWLTLGDLYLQLDQVENAGHAFTNSNELGSNQLALLVRLAYIDLLTHQHEQAQQRVMQWFVDQPNDLQRMALVEYVAQQIPSKDQLLDQVGMLYRQTDRDPQVALLRARLLESADRNAWLIDHLIHRPEDANVALAYLESRRLPDSLAEQAYSVDVVTQIIDGLAPVITANPQQSLMYSRLLVKQIAPVTATSIDLLRQATEADALQRQSKPSTTSSIAEDWKIALWASTQSAKELPDGQISEAQSLLEPIVARYPDLLLARVTLAQHVLAQGDLEQAGKLLQAIDQASDAEAVMVKVRLLLASKQTEEAKALLDAGLKNNPSPDMVAQKAKLLYQAELYNEAAQVLWDGLNSFPQAERLYVMLFAYLDSDDAPDNALEQYQRLLQRAIRDIPDARITRFKVAEFHVVSRRFEQGLRILLPLIEQNPNDIRTVRLTLQAYLAQQKTDLASELIESIIESPEVSDSMLVLARDFYNEIDEEDKAVQVMLRLLDRQPPSTLRSLQRASLLSRLDRHEETASLLEPITDLQGQPALQRITLLWYAQFKLDQYDKALATLKQGLELDPRNPSFHYALSVIYQNTGEKELAEQSLLKTIELDPTNPYAANALAYQWANEGKNLDRALELSMMAVAAVPDSSALVDTLGWIYYKQGKFDQALELLERARQLPDGEYPVILDHLGDAQYQLNQVDRARRTWQQTFDLLSAQEWDSIDDELEGLPDRVQAKLDALDNNQPVPVAPLGNAPE